MFALLIQYADFLGYKMTGGELYREPSEAEINAERGTGIAVSLHIHRLAIDLHLFIDGVYQRNSEAHRKLGEFWEFIGGSWGGRFKDEHGNPKPDGNHYSLEHNGVK